MTENIEMYLKHARSWKSSIDDEPLKASYANMHMAFIWTCLTDDEREALDALLQWEV